MLQVDNLRVSYGPIQAIKGLSLSVNRGEIVALIGANGAGKSTVLRTISGLVRPVSGKIIFLGEDITSLPANKIVQRGIVHVPEGRRIFANLSVMENLELAAFLRMRRDRKGVVADFERVFALFPRLKERSKQRAGTLSGGEQQMLAIGRALVTRGQMMLLDEPSMGLAPILVQEIFRVIMEIKKQGMTILLVEQNAFAALKIADRAYVLQTGEAVLQGEARELLQKEEVRKAYLGG
ncbi:amino acid ABC transporter ATPase [Clostridiales bacterium PH28_bin88]|nr:amino acid ABC transporter ATPase [Clostridiales bacterium PH28_bin88]